MKEKIAGFFTKLKGVKKPLTDKNKFSVKKVLGFIPSFIKNHKVWSVIIAAAIAAVIVFFVMRPNGKTPDRVNSSEAAVTRQNIEESITASSVLEANASYTITPLVTGEILSAPFEEGDVVEEGQLMFQFDTSEMETDIESASLNLQKAQNSYNDALEALDDLYIKSEASGTVSTVYVKNGDNVTNGAKIADIYDDSTLKARIPFNSSDAGYISVGDTASVTVVGTGSSLTGKVTEISSGRQSASGRMIVSYVTIRINNPGALMAGDMVTAMIGDIACNDVGTIENVTEKTITAKTSGTVSSLYISAGDYVNYGAVVAVLKSDSAESQLENAELSLRDAQLSKKKFEEKLEDYSITAPISGTVIVKNKKAGEKYEGSSETDSTLAIIYDMSSLSCSLDIDELEVNKIKVGQTVSIIADVSDTVYTGVVENVSINGTIGTNGVTTYPVKVRITEFDEALLPGMNIEAEIIVESAENVLTIPINALNRGDVVYVKGEKTDENDKAPEGYYSVPVKTGVSNDSFIEITDGLSEGDSIYVAAAASESSNENMPQMGGMPGGMGGGGMPGGGMPGGGGGMPGGGMGGGMR